MAHGAAVPAPTGQPDLGAQQHFHRGTVGALPAALHLRGAVQPGQHRGVTWGGEEELSSGAGDTGKGPRGQRERDEEGPEEGTGPVSAEGGARTGQGRDEAPGRVPHARSAAPGSPRTLHERGGAVGPGQQPLLAGERPQGAARRRLRHLHSGGPRLRPLPAAMKELPLVLKQLPAILRGTSSRLEATSALREATSVARTPRPSQDGGVGAEGASGAAPEGGSEESGARPRHRREWGGAGGAGVPWLSRRCLCIPASRCPSIVSPCPCCVPVSHPHFPSPCPHICGSLRPYIPSPCPHIPSPHLCVPVTHPRVPVSLHLIPTCLSPHIPASHLHVPMFHVPSPRPSIPYACPYIPSLITPPSPHIPTSHPLPPGPLPTSLSPTPHPSATQRAVCGAMPGPFLGRWVLGCGADRG